MSEINYSKMFSFKWSVWPLSLPTYGNYGGQGWSGGRYAREGQNVDFSVPSKNSLDELFKIHDMAYGSASNHSQRVVADNALLQAISDLQGKPEWQSLPWVLRGHDLICIIHSSVLIFRHGSIITHHRSRSTAPCHAAWQQAAADFRRGW